jgi:hypothetical protein
MAEPRVLTEDAALRLLAHLLATAELHTIEPPHYAGRRIVEGTLPLLDALIDHGDAAGRDWLLRLRRQTHEALAARRSDPSTFESFLHAAPGEIVRELQRRRARGSDEDGGDDGAA